MVPVDRSRGLGFVVAADDFGPQPRTVRVLYLRSIDNL